MILCGIFLGAIYLPEYFIAIKKNEGEVLSTLDSYIPLLPPKDKFYADPFLFEYEDRNYIFFEDYDYHKGVISYVSIDENREMTVPKVALELPTHLSFPCVFQEEEKIYMVPETYDYRSVSLFKAVRFPDQWQHVRTLIRGEKFSDSILFKHNEYYWLFTSVKKDRLRIYYAKDLNSTFYPHPINRRHIRGRNAGYVYFKNGHLIRPVMDCRIRYGRSMILKEIVLLDLEHFIEKEIAYIEPNWTPYLTRTHTYSQNEEYVVYDGSYR
jgi:hypothetical protein